MRDAPSRLVHLGANGRYTSWHHICRIWYHARLSSFTDQVSTNCPWTVKRGWIIGLSKG